MIPMLKCPKDLGNTLRCATSVLYNLKYLSYEVIKSSNSQK